MIKSVTVINSVGRKLTIELRNPEKSGFLIYDITGLGPVKATVNMTEILSTNGSVFNSARLTSRNIVISLRYLWANTIEEARLASYQWFKVGDKIELVIETDARVAYVEGYVESNEPVIFEENSYTQVSILCPSSYLYDYNDGEPHTMDFDAVQKSFEFPFSNESTSEKLIIFGNILNNVQKAINYPGDNEVGFDIEIHATGGASDITLHNVTYNEFLALNVTLVEGDTVYICTQKGQKKAYLVRGGTKYSLFGSIALGSKWLTLRTGENVFKFQATSGSSNLECTISYRIAYEGV